MAIYLSHFAAWSTVFISFGMKIWPHRPYRVLEHYFVRSSQSVYFARTQIACFLRWLLLQVGMCGQVLILSFYKLKKKGMRWSKIESVMPLKWPYWGKQKGSLRVRHVRRLSTLYGRAYLFSCSQNFHSHQFIVENVFIKLRVLTPSCPMYLWILCFWRCKAYWSTSHLDLQENSSSFLWSSQSTNS